MRTARLLTISRSSWEGLSNPLPAGRPVMHAGKPPPPPHGQTNTRENISLPQTSCAGGKNPAPFSTLL